jgi:hypothetical protein
MASRLKSLLLAVFLLSASPLTPAFAIPIEVSFTASGFGAGAPTDPVTGSVVYDAASTTSVIDSLTSIDLTIAGHTYSLAEVGFAGSNLIGGLINGVGTVVASTNDFFLLWNATTLSPFVLSYSSIGAFVFSSFTFPQFSVTAAAVPEPGSLALLLAGVLASACLYI